MHSATAGEQDERPLVLVLAEDPDLLERVRKRLRSAGVLSAAGRSVEAAVRLLSQVQVNGCALAQHLSPADAAALEGALEQFSPRCVRLTIEEYAGAPLHGWRECRESSIAQALSTPPTGS